MNAVGIIAVSLAVLSTGVACGGKVAEDPGEPGPVHVGPGVYELSITARSDDCVPPLLSGHVGDVAVVVATGRGSIGVNFPLLRESEDQYNPARSDVSSVLPVVIETEVFGCPAADYRLEAALLAATGTELVVHLEETWSGLDSCTMGPPYPVMSDCTSDREYHFRWLRACSLDRDAVDLESCP